jgi:hypothetical protein
VSPSQPETSSSDATAWATLGRVDEWVRHADAKLAAVLAADLVAAGVLISLAFGRRPSPAVLVLAALGGAASLAGLICATLGLTPRVVPPGGRILANPLFFGDVARDFRDADAYAQALASLAADRDDLFEALAHQVFATSVVAAKKFRWAGRALLLLVIAILFGGAATCLGL